MASSTTASSPSPSEYDLTYAIAKNLDRHMVLPLLEVRTCFVDTHTAASSAHSPATQRICFFSIVVCSVQLLKGKTHSVTRLSRDRHRFFSLPDSSLTVQRKRACRVVCRRPHLVVTPLDISHLSCHLHRRVTFDAATTRTRALVHHAFSPLRSVQHCVFSALS
jgi:hypothetical protein